MGESYAFCDVIDDDAVYGCCFFKEGVDLCFEEIVANKFHFVCEVDLLFVEC